MMDRYITLSADRKEPLDVVDEMVLSELIGSNPCSDLSRRPAPLAIGDASATLEDIHDYPR